MKKDLDNCTNFDEKFLEVLGKYSPLKRKLLGKNNVSYVSESLQKATMTTEKTAHEFI